MGHRVDYIIKDNEELLIYYNKWHANLIAKDLYMGENAFIDFVMSCEPVEGVEYLMNRNFAEGNVIIDVSSKRLYFWYREYPYETSVMEYYVLRLAEKWPGWDVQWLNNRMYDGEKILGIDYISQQPLGELHRPKKELIVSDVRERGANALVIIKDEQNIFVTKTGYLTIRGILYHGTESIPLLLQRPAIALPQEDDCIAIYCIIIDTARKHLLVSESDLGAWEQTKDGWPGYTFEMGDYGYIKTLRLAGIDGEHLKMPEEDGMK